MAYLLSEKNDYIERFEKLHKKLRDSGHKSIGDWLFSEIAEIYNSPTFQNKLNISNVKRSTIEMNSKTLNSKNTKPNTYISGLKSWLKNHNAKNAPTSYLFLPNEINQRISLTEIFKNFDADQSSTLE